MKFDLRFSIARAAVKNMRSINVRQESLSVTRMEGFWYDDPLKRATGFVYKFGTTFALVSNYHVIAGRNALTGLISDPDGKTPTRIDCILHFINTDKGLVRSKWVQIDLYEDGTPMWWQHPGYRDQAGEQRIVDIAAIPLNKISDGLTDGWELCAFSAHMVVAIGDDNRPLHAEHAFARVGSEVFILGYPQGLDAQGPLPIWKRGSIASEPLVNLDGNLPVFYVDGQTRHGMSGSPILYFGRDLITEEGVPVAGGGEINEPWLMGIYAGRRGSAENEVDLALGRAWRRPLIDETIMKKVPGGSPLSAGGEDDT